MRILASLLVVASLAGGSLGPVALEGLGGRTNDSPFCTFFPSLPFCVRS